MTTVEVSQIFSDVMERPSFGKRARRLMRQQPVGVAGAVMIAVLLTVAVLAGFISPYDPNRTIGPSLLQPGEQGYFMGTDNLGRDIFSRVIWGSRISLRVGLIAITIGTFGGSLVGLVSGYLGGKADLTIQRFVDIFQAFPALVLLIAIVSVVGASTTNAMLVIGFFIIASTSRVVRSAVLSVKNTTYVEAGRALGATHVRLIARHVLPNVMAPIIVLASIGIGNAIIIEASLSFLGLGTQPPDASWGQMLSGPGRTFMLTQPGMAIFPGAAIAITVLSFNLLGDSLRDVLDPKLRGSAEVR